MSFLCCFLFRKNSIDIHIGISNNSDCSSSLPYTQLISSQTTVMSRWHRRQVLVSRQIVSILFSWNSILSVCVRFFFEKSKRVEKHFIYIEYIKVNILLGEMQLIMMHDWLWRKYWGVLCFYSLVDSGIICPLSVQIVPYCQIIGLHPKTLGLTPPSGNFWICGCGCFMTSLSVVR